MRHPFFLILIVTALSLLSAFNLCVHAAQQPEPVARIAALRGNAVATDTSAQQRPLTVRAALYEGDTIVTGPRGRLQILFSDNTIISIGRDTTLLINEYLWQPDQEEGALHTEVKEGIFRVMGGKITKAAPQNFTTKTPAATIGIRGSMYAGVVTGQQLSVVFQGGRGIVVTNDFGSVEIRKAGYGTHVKINEPPPPPSLFSGDEMNAFTDDLADTDDDENGSENGTADDDSDSSDDSFDDAADETDTSQTPDETDPTQEGEIDQDNFDAATLPPANETDPIIDTSTSWTPPTQGITLFQGSIAGMAVHYDDGTEEAINEPVDILANWYNHKVLGVVYDSQEEMGMPVFFFGDIDGSTVGDIKVFGGGGIQADYNDPYFDQISVVEGVGSGYFMGTDTGTFYFSGSGYDYAIEPADQPALSEWLVEGAGIEVKTMSAPAGSATWQGYVVGISEDMNNIDTDRRLLTGDMTLGINKDTGNINGSISASDGAFSLNNITVGSTYGSAFIADNLFAALLGGGSTPLKEHGNYLVTGPGEEQFLDYATWGYWEAAYSDGTRQYHNHVPGAMWVAGKPTPTTDIAAMAGNNMVGSYDGKVLGSKIDTTSTMQVSEISGTMELTVDFGMLGSTAAINGDMALDDGAMFYIESMGTAGSPHFSGSLSGSGMSGGIVGTMYGPDAGSIGGNFSATNGSNLTYQGIYGLNQTGLEENIFQ